MSETAYNHLINNIGEILHQNRQQAVQQVNILLVQTYWAIGKHIVEYEQKGNEKAEYGSKLFERLAKDLTKKYGKGFGRSTLIYIRKLYIIYPIGETLFHQLGWAHYFELLKIDDSLERSFYEQQTIREKWSVRELKRQKNTALFQRLSLSKDKAQILLLAKQGNIIEKQADIIKDPYIFEFLGIPENNLLNETDLESKLVLHLQNFLLELGKGFAFIGRQYRISIDNQHYFVDLVFYHRILKCFVLIDLKIKALRHADIGQMNFYLNYFKKEENTEGDNDPIGIVLCAEKSDVLVEYALGGIANNLFVSKYQLYLPNKNQLQARIQQILMP
jgi:predicted nuclease of restriction endonuclease-like (RecB) superfamily